MKMDASEDSRERYRQGFDRISWSNTPRPEYQGGVRPVIATPKNVIVIEVQSATAIIKKGE